MIVKEKPITEIGFKTGWKNSDLIQYEPLNQDSELQGMPNMYLYSIAKIFTEYYENIASGKYIRPETLTRKLRAAETLFSNEMPR